MKEFEYGYFKDGKIFRKGFLEYPDREIGEIRNDEESTFNYFSQRFNLALEKVKKIEQEIEEAENKGSYLMKLIHMKKFLSEFDAVGDFVSLYHKLDLLEIQLKELIEINRLKNLEVKKALIAELEEAVKLENLKEATEKVLDIKSRWIRTGNVKKDKQDEIEQYFQDIITAFYEKKRIDYEERQKLIQKNVIEYEKLIAEAEFLLQRGGNNAGREFSFLQKKWKSLGKIPAKQRQELWEKFNKIKIEIKRKQRRFGHQPSGRYTAKDPVQEKYQLIKQAEGLIDTTDRNAMDEVKKLQNLWNKSGKIAPDKYKPLASRFFLICDEIIEKAFLNNLAENKSTNYADKSDTEKTKIKIRLLQDLISRDERELDLYSENSQNFNTDGRSINKLIGSKLSLKKRKLKAKNKILKDLNELLEKKE